MRRPLLLLTTCALLAACGGRGDSSLNPLRWFGGGERQGPSTLEPEGGYQALNDARLPVPQLVSARWEPTVEGRLLVVTAMAPVKGWWNVALVTETPQPPGRVRPDADGVLRLRMVGLPPPAGSADARRPAQPGPDTLTVAFPLSNAALNRIDAVTVNGGNNALTVRR